MNRIYCDTAQQCQEIVQAQQQAVETALVATVGLVVLWYLLRLPPQKMARDR